MAQADGSHAWLFQYRPAGESEWLEKLKNEKRVPWRIVRWAGETAIDDLVFFWESGRNGGLRGWGLVSEEPYEGKSSGNRKVWRVPVQVLQWLETPISRSAVISADVFNPDNLYLSMPQGANFRLEPSEAERMLTLIPDTPVPFGQLQALVSHHARKEESERIDDPGFGNEDGGEPEEADLAETPGELPEAEYSLDEVAPDDWFTPLARELLNQASFRSERFSGPISSTRLFLAICGLAESGSASNLAVGDERAALDVIHAVASRHVGPLGRMRANYLREQSRSRAPTRTTITQTIMNLLDHARSGELAKAKGGRIGVDDLIIAIFTVDAGRLPQRLDAVDLSLQQIKQEIAYEDHSGSAVLADELFGLRGKGRAAAPRTHGPARLKVPVVRNDNPWQEGQKDVMGAEREAQAFAALALSPSFIPPLAVGVFGEWGSGKSFFMRLAYENIKRFSDQAREQGATASLLGGVVQIRFNAWHYVDTNLWASLVDHIFTELDRATSAKQRSKSEKLFEQLATARELTLESAETLVTKRKEQKDAALAVADSERRLDEAEHRASTSPKIYWEAIRRDFFQRAAAGKKDLLEAANRLGISSLKADIRPFAEALGQLEGDRQRATVVAEGIKRQLGSWWMMGGFALACVVAPAVIWGARELLANTFSRVDFRSAISEWTVWTSGILAAGAGVFAEASRRVRNAIGVVQSFREKFDEATAHVLAVPSSDLNKQRNELARLSAEVEEGKSRLAASTERLSQAAREYNSGTGRARLLGFVRARAAGESYVRHLGLVATIRKDFEELSELIAVAIESGSGIENSNAGAREELLDYTKRVESLIAYAKNDDQRLLRPEEEEKLRDTSKAKPLDQSDSIDRIVLYIDDLDRCQPEKVAEVLQAVHLLLSFKLFVVFVAVDVRWVSKALQKHYPMLSEKSEGDGSATAHDYLEKIFQVPYWVRPMSERASADFMRDRLALPPRPQNSKPNPLGIAKKSSEADSISVDPAVSPSASEGAQAAPVVDALAATDYPKLASNPSQAIDSLNVLSSQLELSDEERDLMVRLARCAGDSPRRLLRFLNVYQVAKASLHGEHEQEELYLLMTQIAIGTGAPDLVHRWITVLSDLPRFTLVDGVLKRVEKEFEYAERDQLDRLVSALLILKAKQSDVVAGDLLRYCEMSSRYSFTGGKLNASLSNP